MYPGFIILDLRDCIQNGNILEAICLVNELHPQLLDNDRYLLFHLQQQHLIELIRDQKVEGCISIVCVTLETSIMFPSFKSMSLSRTFDRTRLSPSVLSVF